MTEKKWVRLPSGKLINTDFIADAEWQDAQRTVLYVNFSCLTDGDVYIVLHDEDAYALYMFLASISYSLGQIEN